MRLLKLQSFIHSFIHQAIDCEARQTAAKVAAKLTCKFRVVCSKNDTQTNNERQTHKQQTLSEYKTATDREKLISCCDCKVNLQTSACVACSSLARQASGTQSPIATHSNKQASAKPATHCVSAVWPVNACAATSKARFARSEVERRVGKFLALFVWSVIRGFTREKIAAKWKQAVVASAIKVATHKTRHNTTTSAQEPETRSPLHSFKTTKTPFHLKSKPRQSQAATFACFG